MVGDIPKQPLKKLQVAATLVLVFLAFCGPVDVVWLFAAAIASALVLLNQPRFPEHYLRLLLIAAFLVHPFLIELAVALTDGRERWLQLTAYLLASQPTIFIATLAATRIEQVKRTSHQQSAPLAE